MQVKIDASFMKEITNNTFLRKKYVEFDRAMRENTQDKFFDENPDFVQMMMHLASSNKIKIIED